jgi:hypothetical protein
MSSRSPPKTLDPVIVEYLITLHQYNQQQPHLDSLEEAIIDKPAYTQEIKHLLMQTGYTEQELLSVLDICEPDMDGFGDVSGDAGYYFKLEELI